MYTIRYCGRGGREHTENFRGAPEELLMRLKALRSMVGIDALSVRTEPVSAEGTAREAVVEKDLVREYKRSNPRSRATSIIVYDVNTAARKGERCILCGAKGPTWAARWPKTKAAEQWATEHRRLHLERQDPPEDELGPPLLDELINGPFRR